VATFSVRVTERGDGSATYGYELRSGAGDTTGPLEQEYTVGVAQTLVRDLCARMDDVVSRALAAAGTLDHRAELARYGASLFHQLFPAMQVDLPELVARLRESDGTLLVRTNESVIPWELLHDGTDFLGLSRDLGRQAIVGRRIVGGRAISRINKALIVADPLGDMPAAQREAERITGWLTSHGTTCDLRRGAEANLVDIVMALESGEFDLFHFCGHVAPARGYALGGLLLHGRDLLDDRALQGTAKIGAPPVVFLNGCSSAGDAVSLCTSFMVLGAKAVIGTRHEVEADSAQEFAEQFYRRLLDGATAGAAVRDARRYLLERRDAGWASFLLYGDPAVHIDETSRPPADVHAEDTGIWLDAAAAELIAQARRRARGGKVVTSLDLLVPLLAGSDLGAWLAGEAGADQLARLVEVLDDVLDQAADDDGPAEPAGGGDVPFSGTVGSVLLAARTAATADGRRAATTADLAAAFVKVGGGSAAQVLEVCGISLATVAPGLAHGSVQLFDARDRLRPDRLQPAVSAALAVALMLAKRQRAVVSTDAVLLGLAAVGAPVLRRCLAEQGEAGARALERLPSTVRPRRDNLSRRTARALEEAQRRAPANIIDEANLLQALLADDDSTVCERLRELGIDVDRLRQAIGAG
jgi:CHAT domain/Clp amino terminal domain, pathogenicity island component